MELEAPKHERKPPIYIDVRVIGQVSEVGEFLRLCKVIHTLGLHGSSREIKLDVDGDGSGFLRFEVTGSDGTQELEPFDSKKFYDNEEDYLELYIGE